MEEFPNMATSIICRYVKSNGLNGPPESIQPHIRMLCTETKKVHPLFVSCVKEIYNNVDWEFIKQYFSKDDK